MHLIILFSLFTLASSACDSNPTTANLGLPITPPTVQVDGIPIKNRGTFVIKSTSTQSVVECLVSGRITTDFRINLQCGALFNKTIDGPNAAFYLSFNRTWSGTTCVCSPSHVSGCYTEKSSFQLSAKSQTLIRKFTANGNSDSYLEVPVGQNVTLDCEVDGQAGADMNISGTPAAFKKVVSQGPVQELNQTFIASLDKSGTYTCSAISKVQTFDPTLNRAESSVSVDVKTIDIRIYSGKLIRTEFTANNQSENVVVKPGTVVEFVCRSSKMPLAIKDHHNGRIMSESTAANAMFKKISVSEMANCTTAGKYDCTAGDETKSLYLIVACGQTGLHNGVERNYLNLKVMMLAAVFLGYVRFF
ncbi:uncharacterized protein LOC131948893 isoform X2 [Physella acuta]|uniref:uncharacterized protein LOC131948893 isoform X2 n=1 Tax=Physella acuta TaxID=109671 RepID=UPI0027DD8776|nr:uncharacterized protein LOC131948893 isoform X2 [Physella acuta]